MNNWFLNVTDMVCLQPYIQKTLRQETEDSSIVSGVGGNIQQLLYFKQNVKEPVAILVEKVPSHNKHIQDMCLPSAPQFIESGTII